MKITKLAEYLSKLENTSKRLEITEILKDLITELKPDEIRETMYLILGYLRAPFENPKFNIADKMMYRVLEAAYSTPSKIIPATEIQAMYNKSGDLGNVAFEVCNKSKKSDLSIKDVHERLVEIALVEGSGSQDLKVKKTSTLLKELDPQSAKYIVRMILGTTRLGFTELTIIAALASFLSDKTAAKDIEMKYNLHPDIGIIAEKIKAKGMKGLAAINIQPGVPVLSQKAQRLDGPEEAIEKMGTVWAEYKFDGTRVQLHMDRNVHSKTVSNLFEDSKETFLIKTFTRNLEETTHQYPDILEAADKQIAADSVILDGEAIGYNKETGDFLPFQETMQRKRKNDIAQTAKDIPLKYFVFDVLYANGKSLTELSLEERKKVLKSLIKPGETIVQAEYVPTDQVAALLDYYNEAKEKELEGLVVKNPKDPYQAGARSFSWVKLKKANQKLLDDSVDCVVLGYYAGRGARSKFGIGGFLAAVYDKATDTLKTVTKVGSGLTDEEWVKLKSMCDKIKVNKLPANVDYNKVYQPDVMTTPKIVVELGADEITVSSTHTAGYALRFPRLLNFRTDKNATEATTTKEIRDMFDKQRKAVKSAK